jgi:hypothetical protein
MNEPTYLEPLNKDAALRLSEDIDALLGQISTHEIKLARSYARLGGLLREVKNQQYWMSYGYDRFSSYLEFVRGKIGRERSQVYAILSVAEALLPLMTESELETVGITKAHELRRLVGQGGSLEATFEVAVSAGGNDWTESVRIMDYAASPKVTAKQLRVKVNEILHIHEDRQGLWFDPGGFYATPDERKEIDQFWSVGRQLFGSKDEQPDHVWKKEVFLAAIRESLSTWAAEVADGR